MPWPNNVLSSRLKIRHMRFIVTMAETRSLTLAASEMAISYPAAIKTRQEIEEAIGGRLTTGRGESAQFSEIGERLLRSCRLILDELDCTGEEISALRHGLKGKVSVGVRVIDGLRWVAPALIEFRHLYPGVEVSLVDGLHEEALRGTVDLVIARLGLAKETAALSFHSLRKIRSVIVSSRSLATGRPSGAKPPPLKALLSGSWCLPPTGSPLRDRFDAHLRLNNLAAPTDVLIASDGTSLAELLRAGQLYGISSELVAPELVAAGIARIVIPTIPELNDDLALIWKSDARHHPAVVTLKAFLLERT